MIKIIKKDIIQLYKFIFIINAGINGIIIKISISKIKKITAIIKNWIENGRWGGVRGLNPHSKGEGFSRSINIFFEIEKLIIIIIVVSINGIIDRNRIVNITYIINNNFFNWKLNVICYILYK